MSTLIRQLIAQNYLRTPEIIKAFQKIKREDFLPDYLKNEAEENYPLPIGFGQTISQPLTVAFMFELLQPQRGHKILDIGSGSGWTTALLAEIVGEEGRVYAIERIRQLKELGEENVKKYNFIKKGIVQFFCADGSKGLSNFAPFDRIIAAAAASKIPPALLEQLIVQGRLVLPVGEGTQDIVLVKKLGRNNYQEERHSGFVFVPLIQD